MKTNLDVQKAKIGLIKPQLSIKKS